MPFTKEQEKLLQEKLDQKHVIEPTGERNGPKGSYIEGWHAIAEANRIFGHGGWSYDIRDMRMVGEGTNKNGNPYCQYTCIIEVEAGGCKRVDVGYGSGFGQEKHENAVKEAATDALKRALRSFGNPFGLALYDKTRENVGNGAEEPEQKPEQLEQKPEQKPEQIEATNYGRELANLERMEIAENLSAKFKTITQQERLAFINLVTVGLGFDNVKGMDAWMELGDTKNLLEKCGRAAAGAKVIMNKRRAELEAA